jgi:hypothetical protein
LTEMNGTGRSLRARVGELLQSEAFYDNLTVWDAFPPRKVVNPLLSFLYSADESHKWKAVTAVGLVVARMAEEDLEHARNVMRRLIWNLNDESGGIGWGSPEAMGEIMAREPRIAEEFVRILVSYVRLDGNLIGHITLERGVLWGLGRLAQASPRLLKDSVPCLLPYLRSSDSMLRGLAAWIFACLKSDVPSAEVEPLLGDRSEVRIFEKGRLINYRIGDLAAMALS